MRAATEFKAGMELSFRTDEKCPRLILATQGKRHRKNSENGVQSPALPCAQIRSTMIDQRRTDPSHCPSGAQAVPGGKSAW
jgi:hypothetical protein